MAFGVIVLYSGYGILFHSIATVIVVLAVVVSPYILYIKLIEEKGLVTRFGNEYLKYKKETRFMLRLPKRHGKA